MSRVFVGSGEVLLFDTQDKTEGTNSFLKNPRPCFAHTRALKPAINR